MLGGEEQVVDLTGLDDEQEEEMEEDPKLNGAGFGGHLSAEVLQHKLTEVEGELTQVEQEISHLLARQTKLRAARAQYAQLLQAEQLAPRKDWSKATFSWDDAALQLLRSTFKLDSYRPLQREVINATLQGRDVLCLLPSGGGKSLCYQLPALLLAARAQREGGGPQGAGMLALGQQLTLVVSPLLSLIQDQVAHLTALGIHAAALTSLSSKEETAAVLARLAPAKPAAGGKAAAKGAAKQHKNGASSSGAAGGQPGQAGDAGQGADEGLPLLLYVTPERIVASKRLMSKLEKLYEAGQLVRIAVDEAHCASQWGNDFRPDYKKLGVLRTMFPKVPQIALTATATRQVQQDILRILNTPGAELFTASINRPNLFYQVAAKPATAVDAAAALVSWITAHYPDGESGIVYALTRKDCEVLCGQLVESGVSAVYYHADMQPSARQDAHEAWARGEAQVVVATIAFGMGINKPDVRFVVHASLSKSVENYYQESGRAGRDGLPARCLLFYRFSDALRQAAIVCYEPNWWTHLQGILSYAADSSTCRRAALQAHFSEAPAECRCMCDVCLRKTAQGAGGAPEAAASDMAAAAASVVRALSSLPHAKATLLQLQEAWRKADKATAKSLTKDVQEQLVEHMLLKGYLQLDFGATAYATNVYLTPTDAGRRLAAQLDAPPGKAGAPRLLLSFRPEGDPLQSLLGSGDRMDGSAANAVQGSAAAAAIREEAEEALRTWRHERAQAERLLPEALLCDALLQRLCDLLAQHGSQGLMPAHVTHVLGTSSHTAAHAMDILQVLQGCSTLDGTLGRVDLKGTTGGSGGPQQEGGQEVKQADSMVIESSEDEGNNLARHVMKERRSSEASVQEEQQHKKKRARL